MPDFHDDLDPETRELHDRRAREVTRAMISPDTIEPLMAMVKAMGKLSDVEARAARIHVVEAVVEEHFEHIAQNMPVELLAWFHGMATDPRYARALAILWAGRDARGEEMAIRLQSIVEEVTRGR